MQSNQKTEVEKFKGRMKEIELETKSANKLSIGRLKDTVNLEREKIKVNGANAPIGQSPEEIL